MSILLKLRDDLSSGMSRANAAIEANGRAVAQLGAQYRTAAAEATRAHEQIISGARGASGAIGNILQTAAGFAIANVGIRAFGASFGFIKDSVIGFNDTIDRTRIALTTMLGSAEAADRLLRDMADFARTTPFEFEGLAKLAPMLIQAKFAAADVIPTLTAVGDSVAASGRGAVEVDRVVLALTQMADKGKVSGEEIRQLAEAGVAALPILAAGFHTTTGAVADMAEKGLLPADRALKVLIEGMETRAPGAMEKMSHTASGAASNIHDAFQQLIGGAFRPAYDALVKLENKLADALQTREVQQFAATVAAAFSNLTTGIERAFSGDQAGARSAFAAFGQQAQSAIKQVELALLTLADAAAPAVEPITEAFARLVGAAAQWGADLIVNFATGIAAAASSVLSAVMSEIADAVASWIHFSKPDKGPLRDVEVWGAEMLTNFFRGASQADFSVLDDALSTVKDILTTQFNNGGGGTSSAGFIPALLGSEAAVAQAISDIKDFGDISEETFSTLGRLLGEDAPAVADLIRNMEQLTGLKDQMAELDRQVAAFDRDIRAAQRTVDDAQRAIDRVDRQIADLNRTFEDQKRPVQDAIDALTRYYDLQERRGRDAITLADQQLAAIRRLHQPQLDQLTDEQQRLQLTVDQQRLTELQNAPAQRAQQLQQDVASASLALRTAQDALAQLNASQGLTAAQAAARPQTPSTPLTAQAAAVQSGQQALELERARNTLTSAQLQFAQAQQRLANEGHQTDADRLAIAQQQQRILEDQLAVEGQSAQRQRDSAQAALDELGRVRELDPLLRANQDALQSMADDHERALRALEDQRRPLEDNLQIAKDHVQELQDARQLLLDQKQDLEDQAKPLQDAIALVQTRFAHEKDVSDQLQRQLDLLNQQAAAAGGAGGAGGAGRAGGLGAGGVGLTGAGLGINIPRRPGQVSGAAGGIEQVEAEAAAASARSAQIDQQLATLGEKVKAAWSKGITDGFDEGIKDIKKKLEGDWLSTAIKAAIALIDYKLFGPVGGLIGLAIADNVVDTFTSGDAKTKLDIGLSGVIGLIVGSMFGGPVGAFVGAQVGAWVGANIVAPFSHALDTGIRDGFDALFTGEWSGFGDRMKVIGGAIVDGLQRGVGDAWGGFSDFVGSQWDDFLNNEDFGVRPLWERFTDIGGKMVEGVKGGIDDKWDQFTGWLGDRWEGMVNGVKHFLRIASPSGVFYDIGTNLLQGLLDGVTDLWTKTVGPFFKNLPGNIIDAVDDVTTTLRQKGIDVITGFGKGVSDLWEGIGGLNGIKNFFATLPEKIVATVPSLLNTLWQSGADLMGGFFEGLKSIWDTKVAPWLADRGRQALSAINPANYIPGLGDLRKKLGDDEKDPSIKIPGPPAGALAPTAMPAPSEGQRIYTSPQTYWEYRNGQWQQHSTLEGGAAANGPAGTQPPPEMPPVPAGGGTPTHAVDERVPPWDTSVRSQETPIPPTYGQQYSATCRTPWDIVVVAGQAIPCYELMGGSLTFLGHQGFAGLTPGTPVTAPPGGGGGGGMGMSSAAVVQAIVTAVSGLTISVNDYAFGQVVSQQLAARGQRQG